MALTIDQMTKAAELLIDSGYVPDSSEMQMSAHSVGDSAARDRGENIPLGIALGAACGIGYMPGIS